MTTFHHCDVTVHWDPWIIEDEDDKDENHIRFVLAFDRVPPEWLTEGLSEALFDWMGERDMMFAGGTKRQQEVWSGFVYDLPESKPKRIPRLKLWLQNSKWSVIQWWWKHGP